MTNFDVKKLYYNDAGLIPAIVQDYKTKDVLMMAWMNEVSILETLNTKQVTYWSRSRKELWRKGATSGHTQELKEFRLDCDRDCLLLFVEQTGPACHTNRQTCFYISVSDDQKELEIMKPIA